MNSPERGFFDGLNRGPSIIKTIRSEVLEGQQSSVEPKAQIEAILVREAYLYLPFTQEELDESLDLLGQYIRAAQAAQDELAIDPHHLDRDIASALHIDPAGITNVRALPVSVSAELDSATYNEFDEKLTGTKVTTAVSNGMANPDWKMGILPVTIARQGRGTTKTPEHEDLHVQYRLLHPSNTQIEQQDGEATIDPTISEFEGIVLNRDYESFTEWVQGSCRYWLRNYLDELSAGAITKRTDAYHGSFSDATHIYYQGFQGHQQEMRDQFPDDIASHLHFEMILYEEVKRTEYRARLIQDAYNQLSKTYDEPDLIAICNFLTPDQGYLINAFKDKNGLRWKNRRQLRQWRTDYEDGGQTKVTSNEVIETLLRISREDNDTKNAADLVPVPPFEDQLAQIQAQFEQRFTRLSTFFDDPQYKEILSSFGVAHQSERIKEEVLLGLVDFVGQYAAQHDKLFGYIPAESGSPQVYEAAREEVLKRVMVLAGISRRVYQRLKEGRSVNDLFAATEEVPENTAHIAEIIMNGWSKSLLHDELLLRPDIGLIRRIIDGQQGLVTHTKDPETGTNRWRWITMDPDIKQLIDMIYAQSQSDTELPQAWEGLLMMSYRHKAPNIGDWWLVRSGLGEELLF